MGQVDANVSYVFERVSGGGWVTFSLHKGATIIGADLVHATDPASFAAVEACHALIKQAAAAFLFAGGSISAFRSALSALPSAGGTSGPFQGGDPADVVAAMSDGVLGNFANAIMEQMIMPSIFHGTTSHGA
jgi:hypothetical protein